MKVDIDINNIIRDLNSEEAIGIIKALDSKFAAVDFTLSVIKMLCEDLEKESGLPKGTLTKSLVENEEYL